MVVRHFSVSGGLELYTHKLVEGLIDRGYPVTVICQESDSPIESRLAGLLKFPGPPAGSSKSATLSHFHRAVTGLIDESGPFDIVHSQHFPIANADVVTFHNQTASRLTRVGYAWERLLNTFKLKLLPAYRLREAYDRILAVNASCLIFPSRVCRDDFLAEYLDAGGPGATPSVVAYPGADLPDSAETRAAVSASPFTFLFVGRGYRKKGLDTLIEACRILTGTRRDFRLIVAGLRKKPATALQLRLSGLENTVEFLGFRQDMGAVYRQAQAFVMPSKLEPFGMAALQAMQFGIPAIVSRVSGVSEVIEAESCGLILENHLSASELAALMEKMILDVDERERMAARCRSVAKQFTWERTVEATLEAYEHVLKAGKRHRVHQR